MITKRLSTLLAVILFMTTMPAIAYTISQTQFFTGIPTISGSLPDFNQFNPGLGTLTSIQVSFTLQSSGGYLEVHNVSPSPGSITFSSGVDGSIYSTDVCLPDISLQVYDGNTFNLNPGEGRLYNGSIKTDTELDFITNAVWYNGTKGFVGTDKYNINFSVQQWSTTNIIGGLSTFSLPPSASGMVTVLYTYNNIPEPATIGLLCMGVLALIKKKR